LRGRYFTITIIIGVIIIRIPFYTIGQGIISIPVIGVPSIPVITNPGAGWQGVASQAHKDILPMIIWPQRDVDTQASPLIAYIEK
jgi:hypothetical protein